MTLLKIFHSFVLSGDQNITDIPALYIDSLAQQHSDYIHDKLQPEDSINIYMAPCQFVCLHFKSKHPKRQNVIYTKLKLIYRKHLFIAIKYKVVQNIA